MQRRRVEGAGPAGPPLGEQGRGRERVPGMEPSVATAARGRGLRPQSCVSWDPLELARRGHGSCGDVAQLRPTPPAEATREVRHRVISSGVWRQRLRHRTNAPTAWRGDGVIALIGVTSASASHAVDRTPRSWRRRREMFGGRCGVTASAVRWTPNVWGSGIFLQSRNVSGSRLSSRLSICGLRAPGMGGGAAPAPRVACA